MRSKEEIVNELKIMDMVIHALEADPNSHKDGCAESVVLDAYRERKRTLKWVLEEDV